MNVTYDANGGTEATGGAATTTTGATMASFATTSRSGYSLVGWFTAASEGTQITTSTPHGQTSSFTLFARWTANMLTVTYDTQGGPSVASTQTQTAGTVSDPGALTRSGYRFDGWFSASSGGTALSFPYAHGRTDDFTLYAQWTAGPSATLSGCGSTLAAGETCTITISLSTDVADLTLDDFTVTRGSLSDLTTSGTSRSVVFTAAGAEGGTGSVQLPAGTITSSLGVTNAASNTLSITVSASDSRQVISSSSSSGPAVPSGTPSTSRYVVQKFRTVGSSTWTVPQGVTSVEYLVVAGGGGGGAHVGGGGGGGGVRTGTLVVTPGASLNVVVGVGGTGSSGGPHKCSSATIRSTNGGDSTFSSITAAGGGGGGNWDYCPGLSGGSGGGGGYNNAGSGNSPSTSPAQGENGGTGSGYLGGTYVGGGGGGAGSAGSAGTSGRGGNGGAGAESAITGATSSYGGGGGGGVHDSGFTAGSGGSGGGGAGTYGSGVRATSGTANSGGGGGGGGYPSNNSNQITSYGGDGGSGIVIVRYELPSVSTPDLAVAADNGSSSTDNLTSATTLTFTGSAPIGALVQLSYAEQGTSPSAGSWTTTGDACVADSSTGVWSCVTNEMAPGKYSIRAVATTYLAEDTVQETSTSALDVNIAGSATKLSIATQPVGDLAGAALATQPVVKLLDSNDLVVEAGSSVNVTATASGGTLGGTTTIATVSGVATFTNLTFAGAIDTDYTLSFAPVSGLTTVVSEAFRVSVGAATQLVLTTSASGAVYDAAFTAQPAVTVRDEGGNTVTSPTYVVTATVSAGTVVGTGNTTLTATTSGGTATFEGLGITGTPGDYTITYEISVGATTVSTSQLITVTKASQSALEVTSTDGAFNTPLTLETSGGSGIGAVSWSVANGTATGCAEVGGALTSTSAGTCTVTATKAQDTNYNAVSSTATTVTIAKANQTTSLTLATTTVTYGQTLTLSGSGGNGDGALSYSVSSGTCTILVAVLTPGNAGSTCQIQITRATSINYLAKTSDPISITITQAAQSISFADPTDRAWSASTFVLSPTASSSLTVTLASNDTAVCTVASGSFIITMVKAGTCSLTASQEGDTNYSAATDVTQTFEISKATQAAFSVSTTSATYGADLTLSTSGGSGTGVVSFAKVSGDCTLGGTGNAILTPTSATSCVVTATKAADDQYNSAVTSNTTVNIAQASQNISFAAPSDRTWSNVGFAVSPTASSSLTVTLASNDTAVCTVASGSFIITMVKAGTCSLTASQAGDTSYSAATDVTHTFEISKATQASLSVSTSTATYGATTTLATSGGSGTGAVSFAKVSGDCTLGGAGNATLSPTSATSCVVTATKAADDQYAATTTSDTTVTIDKAAQSTALTLNSATVDYGQTLTLAGSGGNGDGALSYAKSSGTCAVSGTELTPGNAGSTCQVQITRAASTNYEAQTSDPITITINRATPTIGSLTLPAPTYGDVPFTLTNPTATFNGASVAGTWTYASALDSVATFSGATGTVAGGGSSTITATFTPTDTVNLFTTSVTATLTVAKATPTFTWASVDATYGDANANITAPIVATTAATGTWLYTSATTSVVAISDSQLDFGNAGSSVVTATFTPSNTANYVSGGTVTMTVTVAKATPSLGTLSTMTKTFGEAAFSPTNPTASFNSQALPGSWSYASNTASVATASGTTITIAGAGSATITGTFTPTDTANFETASTTASLTVEKATPTFTWSNVSATYGDSNAAITAPTVATTAATGTWMYSSATTSVVAISGGSFDFGNAGTSVITATFTPDNTTNYVSGGMVQMTVTVGTKAITVTADAQTKQYGEPDPSLTYTITTGGSLASGDSFSGALSRAAGSGVGTYAISQNTLALSANYTLTFVPADLTITRRAITVTAADKSKTYGEGDPTLTYSVTSGSLVGSETLSGSLARTTGDDAGTYAINQGTVTSANNPNYDITFAAGTLTINTKPITVTADAQTKVYGESDPTFTYSVNAGGLVGSDSLSGSLARASGESVGTRAISIGTLTNANYAITLVPANLTITAKSITVTAADKSKMYGEADPSLTFSVTTGSLVGADSLSGSLSRVSGDDAGIYAINQGTVTSSNNPNYTITFVPGTLTINKAAQTAVTLTSTGAFYGVALSLTSSGGSGDGAVTFAVTDAGTAGCIITGATLTTTGGDGTTCTVTVTKATSTNYLAASSAATTVTVGRQAITVTAASKTKMYGDSDPAFTYTITSGALVGSDELNGALARDSGENIGTREIQIGTLAHPNYLITYVPANLTILQRPITLTAANKTKVFAETPLADPALTYTVTSGSLKSGDSFTGAISRNSGESVGSYVIGIGTLSNPNYDITFVNGALTITGATQAGFTLTAASTSIDYQATTALSTSGGNGAGAVTYTVTNGTGECTLSDGTLTGAAAGTCTVTATKAAEGNYLEATSNTVTITVAKIAQTITFSSITDRAFDNTEFAVAPTTTSGRTVSVVSRTTETCTVSGLNITMVYAGTCTLVASVDESANYLAAADVTQSFEISSVVPYAPTISTIAATSSSLSIGFTDGANGGDAITRYAYSLNGTTWTLLPLGGVTSPLSITGLAEGTRYEVRIRAINSVGSGSASTVAAATTLVTPPAPAVDAPPTTTSTTTTTTTLPPTTTSTTTTTTSTTSTTTSTTLRRRTARSTTTTTRAAVTTLRQVATTLRPVFTVPSRITSPSTTTSTVTIQAMSTTVTPTSVLLPPLVTVPAISSFAPVSTAPQSTLTQVTVRPVSDSEAAAVVATTPNNVQDLSLPIFVNDQLPEPNPAQPMVIQTESDVTVQVVTVNNQVVTVTDETGYRLAVAAVDESGTPMQVGADGALLVPRNRFISVNGQGLQPNSVAVAWVFSEPRRLGDVRVSSDGSFSARFRIPRGIPEGNHTTQVNGIDANGTMRSFNLAIEVVAGLPPDIVPAATTHTSDPVDALVVGSLGVQAQRSDRAGYLLLAALLLLGGAWFANGLRLKRRDLETLVRVRHTTGGARSGAVRRRPPRDVQKVELR
ncbi:MAG: beta strand repeat-containing protein [Ilumatobacteraceae bacterium]